MLEKYNDLLNAKELAEILRVSTNVVYDMIKKEQIKVYRFGRDYKCPKMWLINNYLVGYNAEFCRK